MTLEQFRNSARIAQTGLEKCEIKLDATAGLGLTWDVRYDDVGLTRGIGRLTFLVHQGVIVVQRIDNDARCRDADWIGAGSSNLRPRIIVVCAALVKCKA